jgi:hypothetical protein
MDSANDQFVEIQDLVEQMVHKFKVANYGTKVASGMVYDDQTQFTESNI